MAFIDRSGTENAEVPVNKERIENGGRHVHADRGRFERAARVLYVPRIAAAHETAWWC